NRQFYFPDQLGMKKVAALRENLRRIDPDLDMEAADLRLDGGNIDRVFKNCALIVEALDQAADKKMMAEHFMGGPRPLICASGVGGWGGSDRIRTRRIREGLLIVGDGRSEVSAMMPPTSAIVGIAAAKQADAVVEWILGTGFA
ncbi:MAG TPA: ThiF family adenylyltransferase, partial [Desulfosarcina sp.]|nr:ThiF family adenylyltransferase [Desulfosarcina sp.]